MRICIHRGTKQIGGTCIELEEGNERILLDLGLPLDSDAVSAGLLPNVPGLQAQDPTLLGVVLSHGHRDHWGLLPLGPPELPVFMGETTHRIMCAAAQFVPDAYVPANPRFITDRTPFVIGPFEITPFLVDHSAYDAYALLISAGGKRLFYSGDIRGHGRKGALLEAIIRTPPPDIDVLILEGSSIGRIAEDEDFPTENVIEVELTNQFKSAPGAVLISASAQNIDRMVSIFRACKRSGRTFVIDLYAAEVLRATGNPRILQSAWDEVAIYVPERQRWHVRKRALFEALDRHRPYRVFPEHLAGLAPKSVFLTRPYMLEDFAAAGVLKDARAIWSQWAGYLSSGSGLQMKQKLADIGVPLRLVHTSGHASIKDLKRLAFALAPRSVVAVHTFGSEQFPKLFENVRLRNDGEWWSV